MSNQSVFNPKLNIVAVDPDKNEVVQIPGVAFQAETSSDTYEKIALYPNFNPEGSDKGRPGDKDPNPIAPDGQYVIGVGVENRNRYGIGHYESQRSLMFRITRPHIIFPDRYEMYTYQVLKEYDPFIEWTDFVSYISAKSNTSRGWVRFKWQEMVDTGLKFPKGSSSDQKPTLSFDVEIFRGWDATPIEMPADQVGPLSLPTGPYSSPIIIPVRVWINELIEWVDNA